jgi:hypothetical protein
MQTNAKAKPTGSPLIRLSAFLKALWIFFPGIIFLVLGLFIFISLPQGKDIIYQSTDARQSWLTGLYLVLAAIFWVFTTWYTARLIAYDRNDLYSESPWVLFHFPRLLGFWIFLILWLAVYLIRDIEHTRNGWAWCIFLLDLFIYYLFYRYLELPLIDPIPQPRWKRLVIIRYVVRSLIILSFIIVIVGWNYAAVGILLYTLPVFQLGFLFLVIVRRPLYENNPGKKTRLPFSSQSWWDRYLRWALSGIPAGVDIRYENPVFLVYHLLAGFALVCYFVSINYLPFARGLTSFPLVLLGFGVLLGIINLLALVSHRKKVNLNFIVITVIVLAGLVFETHRVRTIKATDPDKQAYATRLNFRQYLEKWVQWHKEELTNDPAKCPVFFTLADGGASRSGYWAASVLASLHEKTRYHDGTNRSYFSDHLFCLSGASGGSVGNVAFLSALDIQQQYPGLTTDTLCMEYLGNDFLVYPLARILGPELIMPAFTWLPGWGDRAAALEEGMDFPDDKNALMGRLIRGSFHQLLPTDQNKFPIVSINTTRVNDGGPGVVSSIHIDSSNVFIKRKKTGSQHDTTYVDSSRIFGSRIDVLGLLPKGRDIRISTAMVLGARFPYMSPGGKIGKNSYFVDGGYFDNSGAGVVHEMLLELNRIANDTSDALHTLVKKMQFYVIHLSNTPYPGPHDKEATRIHPAVNDLATPLLTLAGSYNSQTSVNDARLINYLKELNKERNSYIVFNLYKKDSVESISMNWVISKRVRDIMNRRKMEKRELDSVINRLVGRRTDNLFGGLEQEN